MRINPCSDYPTDLFPINETRKCSKCGAWTWWAAKRQTKRGRCWDCVPGISLGVVTDVHFDRVLDLLLDAFPGCTVSDVRQLRYRPDTYAGPDAGPCVGCGRRVRRYGPDAYLFCLECQPEENS